MLSTTIALTLACAQHPGQQDIRGEIEVPGPRSLAISPSGDLWIGSRDGRLYVSRDRNQYWSEVETPARKPSGRFNSGQDQLEHIGFFDAERAIIAGYIGGDENNEILRTEDGGKTWSFVTLGVELWVYDMQVMSDGHAWLVGSDGKLLASEDFGATWRVAGAPFDAQSRSHSVWFSTADTGVVGANVNAIRMTTDGGRTWQAITTPLRRGHEDRIERVWILGENLLALQGRQLFRHPLGLDGRWSLVEFAGREIVAGEAVPGGLVVVTEDRHIVQISETLEQRLLAPEALDQVPRAIAQDERGCAVLTADGKVCLVEDGRLLCSSLYTKGLDRTWSIATFDRAEDGTLFGTSSTALYRSADSGQTWERLVEKDGLRSVAAFEDGSGVIVTTRDGLATWTEECPVFVPVLVCGANEQRLSVQARKGRLWIATSFETDGGPTANRMLRSSDTVLVGPHFTALVYASANEGRSWKRIDRCGGAIVHALWLGGDDVVSLCMSDNSIRAGKLDAVELPEPDGFRVLAAGGGGLGGHWASWIAFPEPKEGVAGGRIYFGGSVLYRSLDGGRTWTPGDAVEREVVEAYRLGGGACVRVVGFWDENSRVEVWSEGAFHEMRRFEQGVHDARVGATGSLLVRLEDGEVWSLSSDAQAWARIGLIQLPPD